ncbi:hypothetical protein MHYP_G00015070 [Metynnis hypsauchen]
MEHSTCQDYITHEPPRLGSFDLQQAAAMPEQTGDKDINRASSQAVTVMSSALYLVLLFSALWTLSFCWPHQFYVVNEKKTWTDAQKHCRGNFTDLVTIDSQEEMNTLIGFLNGTKGYFWIGLRQKVQQNDTVS